MDRHGHTSKGCPVVQRVFGLYDLQFLIFQIVTIYYAVHDRRVEEECLKRILFSLHPNEMSVYVC